MGRAIRKVPKGWKHPKNERGEYQPLYDEDYETAIADWIENHLMWLAEKHPDQEKYGKEYKYYAEWNGNAPEIEYYRPKWKREERICFQVYETVSEGTPITPVFESKEELLDYLVEHGDFWRQKHGMGGYERKNVEAFIKQEWAPSMLMSRGSIKNGYRIMWGDMTERLWRCALCLQSSTAEELIEMDIDFVHAKCWEEYRKIILQGGDEEKWLKKWRRQRAKTK